MTEFTDLHFTIVTIDGFYSDNGVSTHDIASALAVTPHAAGAALRTMNREGWVYPTREDRVTYWHLTEKGDQVAQTFCGERMKAAARA